MVGQGLRESQGASSAVAAQVGQELQASTIEMLPYHVDKENTSFDGPRKDLFRVFQVATITTSVLQSTRELIYHAPISILCNSVIYVPLWGPLASNKPRLRDSYPVLLAALHVTWPK
jgi:hypothetical protein